MPFGGNDFDIPRADFLDFKRVIKPKLYVPSMTLAMLEYFGEVAGNEEYMLFLSSDVNFETFEATINPEIKYVPLQNIKGAQVVTNDIPDYDDWFNNPRLENRVFNTVVHRHPSGYARFSHEDEVSINQKGLISFLYHRPFNVPYAIMNIPTINDVYVSVPMEIIMEGIKEDFEMRTVERRVPTSQSRLFRNSRFWESDELGLFEGTYDENKNTKTYVSTEKVFVRTVESYEDFVELFDSDPEFNKEYLKSRIGLDVRGVYSGTY